MTDLPYASSKVGQGREAEIRSVLRRAGASAIGFMVDDDERMVICQFRMAGRQVTVPVSIASYERAWLATNPRGPRTNPEDHARRARKIAEVAVWGVLADWIKAQGAMMACGFLDADTAFLPHIHAPDGRRVAEHLAKSRALLPPPQERHP
jgi:hypothetical protein